MRAWGDSGVAVSSQSYDQPSCRIVTDGFMGMIAVWEDVRNGPADIYARKFNSAGSPEWPYGGISICEASGSQTEPVLISDSSGGAIIAWNDERGATSDIYCQRILQDGTVNWTIDGVAVSNAAGTQCETQICEDGSDGAIVVWKDERNGAANSDIYAQRISGSGYCKWATDGVAICAASYIQKNPVVVYDGNGGAIIAWEDFRSNSDYHIYAQKISSQGVVQWGINGVVVSTGPAAKPGDQNSPDICRGNAGEAIITWTSGNIKPDIYALRLDENGSPAAGWSANGIPVTEADNSQEEPSICGFDDGTCIIAWRDYRDEAKGEPYDQKGDIYTQLIKSDGSRQWSPADGVAIGKTTLGQRYPQIIPWGSDGAILTWQDFRTGKNDIYVSKIKTKQASPTEIDIYWEVSGTIISEETFDHYTPNIISDGDTGAIISYRGGAMVNSQIYCQKMCDPDADPPEAITTLYTATGNEPDEIEIQWIAPHEDGEGAGGAVTFYRVRYATSSVNDHPYLGNSELWWEDAQDAVGEPQTPASTGTLENMSVYLKGGATYYFYIRSYDEIPNESGVSNHETSCAMADTDRPSKTQDFTATTGISEGKINLEWTAPYDNETSTFNLTIIEGKYHIQRSTDFSVAWSTADAQIQIPVEDTDYGKSESLALTGLIPGATYYFHIWTEDEVPNVSLLSNGATAMAQIDVTAPGMVNNLSSLQVSGSSTSIKLEWSAPGDDNYVNYSTGGPVGFAAVFKIQFSTFSAFTPDASAAQISISDSSVLPYDAQEKTVTGLADDTAYYFALWTEDESGNLSEYSNKPSTKTLDLNPPNKITTLSAIRGYYEGEIDLIWSAPGDNGTRGALPSGSEYKIQKSTWAGIVWSTSSAEITISTSGVYPGTVVRRTVTGLIQNATYYFHIWTADEVPNWSGLSGGATVAAPPDLVAPGKITSLTSFQVQGSSSSIQLSWSAPGDDDYINYGTMSGFSAEFKIQHSTFSEILWSTSSAQVSITTGNVKPGDLQTRIITGLADDTTYHFHLWTRDEAYNWSVISNTTTTKTPDVVSPLAVGNLSASMPAEPAKISLVWSTPGDNGISEALPGGSSFIIDYATYPSKPWASAVYEIEIPTNAVAPGELCSKIVTGLALQATYYFSVWTIDEAGNVSTNSNVAAARTLDISSPTGNINFPLENKSYGFLNVITGTSTDAYTGIKKVLLTISAGTTYWSGSAWTVLSTSVLTSGTTSWSYDFDSSNWVSGSTYTITATVYDEDDNYFSSLTRFYFDSMPPETITNLSALPDSSYDGRVHLSWSAPQDLPLNIPVENYVIHRATFSSDSIGDTTLWWKYSQEIGNSIPPESSGETENFTISGLTAGVTYYFAVKSVDSIDFFFSTSTISNQAKVVAPYGIYIPTSFNVGGVPSPILAGVPADVTVECRNPDGIAVNYTDWVSFSSTDTAAELPSPYKFTTADQGTHTFRGKVIFGTEGFFSLVVSTADASGKQSGIDVRAYQYEQITSTGKKIEILGDSRINFAFPAGNAMSLKIKISTAGENHTGTGNTHINSSLNNGKAVYGIQIEKGTNPAALQAVKTLNVKKTSLASSTNFSNGVKLTLIYFDFDGDGLEDKSGSNETDLGIFYWDEFNWRYLGGEVNTSSDTISANIYNLGLFGVFPLKSNQTFSLNDHLPKRKIFTPNNDGINDYIEFVGLNKPFKITIYSLAGKIIREITDEPRWYGRSGTGKIAESGIYIYRVKKDGVSKNGTVVIAK